jgi:hypothetical protein
MIWSSFCVKAWSGKAQASSVVRSEDWFVLRYGFPAGLKERLDGLIDLRFVLAAYLAD